MQLHFTKPLNAFEYALCFDLAKYETGISLLHIATGQLMMVYQLSIKPKSDTPMFDFYTELKAFLLRHIAPLGCDNVLIIREKQPSGHGATTTIATLQSLAGVHAIVDVLAGEFGLYEYEDGIHASSVKAWARKVTGVDKPQKTDIADYVWKKHNLSDTTYDITDSIALFECLVSEKWDKDLSELIKEERKHLKSLKAPSAIKKQEEHIALLNTLFLASK